MIGLYGVQLKERNKVEMTYIKCFIYVGTLLGNCVLHSSHNVIPTNCKSYIGVCATP